MDVKCKRLSFSTSGNPVGSAWSEYEVCALHVYKHAPMLLILCCIFKSLQYIRACGSFSIYSSMLCILHHLQYSVQECNA